MTILRCVNRFQPVLPAAESVFSLAPAITSHQILEVPGQWINSPSYKVHQGPTTAEINSTLVFSTSLSQQAVTHLGLGQYTYPPPPPMSDPTATQGWYGGYSYSQTSKSPIPPLGPRGLRCYPQGKIMRQSRSTKLPKSILEVSCSHSHCRHSKFSGLCRHRFRSHLVFCSVHGPFLLATFPIAFNLCCVVYVLIV